ncbi:CynX/NimT family MFS transporter [Heyndrickxia oleronia]|uniref:MFS transporter n=1 Tax=Heyndrickxia oleronia TaxID=38875 RepID=A0AAW6SY02_9BACI|nr:MFS transporter [Heyndrickxia oleronia]MDH5163063.1 MFS transporter [Heyndrickxia oleronia]
MSSQQVSVHQEHTSTVSVKSKAILFIIGIIFIAANLRAPLTSVGPLVAPIRDSLGISNTLAGTLTTVPLLAFALLSPFAPKLSRKFGMETVLFTSLILIAVGITLRTLQSVWTLFGGTVLLGLGIAFGNVLLPSIIKQRFPKKIGLMTGVYAVAMNLCAAIASGLSVPVSSKIGWHGALGYWGFIAFIAILFWIPQIRTLKIKAETKTNQQSSVNLWKSGLAWQITLFMGLQSLIFYTIVAWLPEILKEQGVSSNSAGWMLSLMQFAIIPFTFIVPIIAGRMKNQLALVVLTALFFIVGMFGVLYGSVALIPLWIIIIGIAGGAAFSLAMMFFSLRTRSTHEAAELSGMAQSFGYLLAAIGPTLFGILHDLTHSWTLPLWMLIIASFLILVSGMSAGKDQFVKVKHDG